MDKKCCDNCFYYNWYYDLCSKWNCIIDNRYVCNCWRGSMAEQLICNQQVVGSTPIASSIKVSPR